jgi:HSP20 family protein
MAPEKNSQAREENPRQEAGTAVGTTSRTSDERTQRSDQQRSIQTGREPARSTGVTRRQTSPTYGSTGSPFGLMRRMAEDMDRIFQDFGLGSSGLGLAPLFGSGIERELWRESSALDQSAWVPQIEAFRRGDKLVVRADLPGLKKDDVKVEVDDGILAISGERSEEREENRDDFYRSERNYGQFYRAIPLPEGVTGDQCEATFKDGVLEVTLPAPKQPERKARQIPIRG